MVSSFKVYEKKYLQPEEIITLRDYPIRNERILEIFFRVFHKGYGKILPPCPVISKDNFIKHSKVNSILKKFFDKHPNTKYFLLDGGHKSAAATLAHRLIPVLILESDKDFKIAKKLVNSGELFGWNNPDKSMNDSVKGLIEHHSKTKIFETIEEKIKRMIRDKKLPFYIISTYRSLKT